MWFPDLTLPYQQSGCVYSLVCSEVQLVCELLFHTEAPPTAHMLGNLQWQ